MIGSLRHVTSSRKRLDSPALNLLGIQMFRVLLARSSLRLRRRSTPEEVAEPVAQLAKQGFCVIPDFLPRDLFESVRAEAVAVLDTAVAACKTDGFRVDPNRFARVRPELLDRSQQGFVAAGDGHKTPQTISSLTADERLLKIFAAHQGYGSVEALIAGGRFGLALERLFQFEEGRVSAVSDMSDNELHADTFHTITKAFLYLQDMNADNGPFVFVPQSHAITWPRLRYDYRHSLAPDGVLRYRCSAEDLRRLGGTPESLHVPANTLVVANTQGLHARSGLRPDVVRDTICLQYRPMRIV